MPVIRDLPFPPPLPDYGWKIRAFSRPGVYVPLMVVFSFVSPTEVEEQFQSNSIAASPGKVHNSCRRAEGID